MEFDELDYEYSVRTEANRIINSIVNYINSKNKYEVILKKLESLKKELKFEEEELDYIIHGSLNSFSYGYIYQNENDRIFIQLADEFRSEKKIKELKEQINEYTAKEAVAYVNYKAQINYLNLSHLNMDMLVRLASYFNINIDLEKEVSEYDLRNKIRNSLIEEIDIIISNELDIPLTENYRGKITFINTLINKKNRYELILKEIDSCIKEIDEINDKKDNFESTIQEAKKEIENYKSNLIKKIIYSHTISKLDKSIVQNRKKQGYILVNKLEYVEDLKTLREKLITEYNDYIKIYNVLEVILDKMDKEQLKDICNELNIVITIPDTLYFDLEKEMKKEIIKYFEIQNAESVINDKEQQKILTKHA